MISAKKWVTSVLLAMALAGQVAPVASAESLTVRCSREAAQLQVDTSRGGPSCFELSDPQTLRLDVGNVFGISNRTEHAVHVAFRLPQGNVFWQEEIPAGGVRTLDVDRRRSRLLEIKVGQEPSTAGLGEGQVEVGRVISLSQNQRSLGFDELNDTATTSQYDPNAGFEERLDRSFVVRAGLSDPSCFSFESALYPGVWLTADRRRGTLREYDPAAADATWCVRQESAGVRLQHASSQGWLEYQRGLFGLASRVGLNRTPTNAGIWSVDRGLADPR